MSLSTTVKFVCVIGLMLSGLASAVGADTLSASNSATAELNESAVVTIDQGRVAGTVIVAPKINIDCTGKCSDKLMKSVTAKVVEIQQLVVACKRDVSSPGETQHQVRQIMGTLPSNVTLSFGKAGNTSMRRRSNRQYTAGFCDLDDLSRRTPAF
jgi:hypothetical protein